MAPLFWPTLYIRIIHLNFAYDRRESSITCSIFRWTWEVVRPAKFMRVWPMPVRPWRPTYVILPVFRWRHRLVAHIGYMQACRYSCSVTSLCRRTQNNVPVSSRKSWSWLSGVDGSTKTAKHPGYTDVDKGGPAPLPMAGKNEFFVKVEGLTSFMWSVLKSSDCTFSTKLVKKS